MLCRIVKIDVEVSDNNNFTCSKVAHSTRKVFVFSMSLIHKSVKYVTTIAELVITIIIYYKLRIYTPQPRQPSMTIIYNDTKYIHRLEKKYIFFFKLGAMHFIYQINRLTTRRIESTYLG